MSGQPLLIELFTEELPPKSLKRLGEAFAEAVVKNLRERKLAPADAKFDTFASPRRLAVRVKDAVAQAPDADVLVKGPSVKVGLDANGQPTAALIKFAEKNSVAVSALARMHDGKQDIFAHRTTAKGESLVAAIDTIVQAAAGGLPIAKLMRWGDTDYEFVRPVQGLTVLHGPVAISAHAFGCKAGRVVHGHRFLGARDIHLDHADDYERALFEKGKVVASFAARRSLIEHRLVERAKELGVSLGDYHDLLDEVTALVEWPAIYVCEFEREFLAVPQECLILTMRQNQKYFPLFDAHGKLLSKFLVVSNMEITDAKHIIAGNARVVRPRLADARFFFETDKKTKLVERAAALDTVVYHNKLGSQGARARRLSRLAGDVADAIEANRAQAERAALLAKADLVSGMVGEFPELQGIMGRYYAEHDGEAREIAHAIEQHYWPKFAGDRLPEGPVAVSAALADKLDALAGIFGIGMAPTGDKDPFALRRAALGVVRMLVERKLSVPLDTLIGFAVSVFDNGTLKPDTAKDVHAFILERLRGYLREQGAAPQEIEAVLSVESNVLPRVAQRLAAVREFVKHPAAQNLAAANKRIKNILAKTTLPRDHVEATLFEHDAERTLNERLHRVLPEIEALAAGGEKGYGKSLETLAAIRPEVDRFFDDVLVMAEDDAVRNNRLALLARLNRAMNQVADISKLAV